MAKNNRWLDEKRTTPEYIRDANGGNVWATAKQIGMRGEHLWTWLSDSTRGFRRIARLKLRDGLGIPTVAILERDRPIGEVVREEEEATR